MKVKRIGNAAEVEFAYGELLLLNAVLNEVCNGIDVFEFETRIGAGRAEVERLMGEIQIVLDKIEEKP